MKKAKAIELLKLAVPIKALTQQEYSDFVEAVNMGVDALEQPTSPDTIDRKAALEKVRTMQTYKLFMGDDMILIDKADVQTELMMLPTVQPEPKEGHWIWVAGEVMCSECRTIYSDLYPDYDNAVACPHCGARMTTSK